MITRRCFLAALSTLMLPMESSFASKQKVIRLVYHPNVPPYSFQEEIMEKNVKGILIDLINELSTQLNFEFNHSPYPWKRAQALVETGVADAFCCPVTVDRERYALFAPTPVTTLSESALFFNPYNLNADKIRSARRIEDFYSLKAATFLGNSSHSEVWGAHPEVTEVPEVEQILKMLLRGRVDFYFADPIVTGYIIKQVGLSGLLESIPMGDLIKQDSITQMKFGIRRSYPEAQKVVDAVDLAIRNIITPDLHRTIVNRYL